MLKQFFFERKQKRNCNVKISIYIYFLFFLFKPLFRNKYATEHKASFFFDQRNINTCFETKLITYSVNGSIVLIDNLTASLVPPVNSFPMLFDDSFLLSALQKKKRTTA